MVAPANRRGGEVKSRQEGRMIGALLAKRAAAGAFDAINRHDLPALVAGLRDDAVFTAPGNTPGSGTFEGKAAIEAWFRRWFELFPETKFEVQDVCVRNIFDLVGTNVIAAHWHSQITNREGRTGKNSGVLLIKAQRGKVVALKDFIFDAEGHRRDWGVA
jgi:ketosteroid isomerase-like protein